MKRTPTYLRIVRDPDLEADTSETTTLSADKAPPSNDFKALFEAHAPAVAATALKLLGRDEELDDLRATIKALKKEVKALKRLQ